MSEYIIRRAILADIDFLVETIIEAEKSGTEVLTYSTIFGLSYDETKRAIDSMLREDIEGCELSMSGFAIAEKNNEIAAAMCAWVEGAEGISSTILKGNLLGFVLPAEALIKARSVSHIVAPLTIEFTPGSLCIGLVYVNAMHRGKNLVNELLQFHIQKAVATHSISDVCIQVFANNVAAIKAYSKVGFEYTRVCEVLTEGIDKLLPSGKKVLMTKFI
ncbi:MAG: GNAT family N-acetyltransferase [Bacteroidota bacterium]